jgi:hypothetical protein
MKFLKLNWFKSEAKKELEKLQVEEQQLKIEILKEDLKLFQKEPEKETVSEKPYQKVKLVNNVLTVVLKDGNVLSKPGATLNDFRKIREVVVESQIFDVIAIPEVILEQKKQEEENRKVEKLLDGINNLQKHEDFEVKNGSVYMKGINRTMPKLLVERFSTLVDNTDSVDYESLKKFWMKCCLNPNARSAEDLYEFLQHHQFKIDRHGNFYAYRRVVSQNNINKELIDFVSNTYTKVKAVWKKKPSNFNVYSHLGDFKIREVEKFIESYNPYWEYKGNLEQLYLDLPNMQQNHYTSAHTGKEDYRVGEVISMPRFNGDDDNSVSCSKGYHAASKAYDYSGFGDTPILVIINPMDVLAVPLREVGKLRTCRWFFAAVLDNEEKYILDDEDFDVTDLGDTFEERTSGDLEEYVKNGFAEEVLRHTFDLSPINHKEVTKIVKSLDDMRKAISSRIVEVEDNYYEDEDEDLWMD